MADHAQPLREDDVSPDPLEQFRAWFAQAREAGVREPEAMVVATATRDGAPSSRVVLCKAADERGFVFFTNYASRKGRELAANPLAALLFHWDQLGRQVRIEGAVERVSREETDAYVATRARASQISALASEQSRVLASRAELEDRVDELEHEFADRELPSHPSWGGFRVEPVLYEFWQNRRDRLHDRLQYRPDGAGGWVIERLAP